jgi:ubiquitin thioesterase protein OTUB1
MLASLDDPTDKVEVLKQTWRSLLDAANFDRIAYEDFFDDTFFLIKEFCEKAPVMKASGMIPSDWLAENWRASEVNSNSVMLTLRMVLSAYLQLNFEEYLPFLYDFESSGLSGKQLMESYCRRHVESFGVESDQIHIMAMTKVMGCQIEIAYLDAGESSENLLMSFGEGAGFWGEGRAATLLYRPGHYDLIYRK